jgi:hypothetical protein
VREVSSPVPELQRTSKREYELQRTSGTRIAAYVGGRLPNRRLALALLRAGLDFRATLGWMQLAMEAGFEVGDEFGASDGAAGACRLA